MSAKLCSYECCPHIMHTQTSQVNSLAGNITSKFYIVAFCGNIATHQCHSRILSEHCNTLVSQRVILSEHCNTLVSQSHFVGTLQHAGVAESRILSKHCNTPVLQRVAFCQNIATCRCCRESHFVKTLQHAGVAESRILSIHCNKPVSHSCIVLDITNHLVIFCFDFVHFMYWLFVTKKNGFI